MSDRDKELLTYNQWYYRENKEKMRCYNKEYLKTYYQNNKERFKTYYKKNREQRLDYQKAYQKGYTTKNKDQIKAYQAKYWQERKKKIYLRKSLDPKPEIPPSIIIDKTPTTLTFD